LNKSDSFKLLIKSEYLRTSFTWRHLRWSDILELVAFLICCRAQWVMNFLRVRTWAVCIPQNTLLFSLQPRNIGLFLQAGHRDSMKRRKNYIHSTNVSCFTSIVISDKLLKLLFHKIIPRSFTRTIKLVLHFTCNRDCHIHLFDSTEFVDGTVAIFNVIFFFNTLFFLCRCSYK
jgi:hypothetical protein